MTAHEVMTSDPATVTPTATIAEAWDLMREFDIRHLRSSTAGRSSEC